MLIVFVVVAGLLVVGIGLVAVGAVTGRLAQEPRRSVFDLEEAVQFVAERLPDDITAVLSFDDVRAVMTWHLDYLESRGVAGQSDHDLEGAFAGPNVAEDAEGIAYVLGQATDAGLEVDDVQVVEILEAEEAYLEAIGAIGAAVPEPLDPDT